MGTDQASFPGSYVGKIAASLEAPATDGRALYPSDLPGSPVALSPTPHGNGFWNSGGLDAVAAARFRGPAT